ncbi:hypothetical protein ACLK1T_12795 [Escherichia coli]
MLKLGLAFGGALIGWMLAYGGYDAAEKRRTAPRLASLLRYSRLFRRFVILLSAIIAKRYYSLTTHNLKTVMEQLAQGNAVASNNSPLKKCRTKERQ